MRATVLAKWLSLYSIAKRVPRDATRWTIRRKRTNCERRVTTPRDAECCACAGPLPNPRAPWEHADQEGWLGVGPKVHHYHHHDSCVCVRCLVECQSQKQSSGRCASWSERIYRRLSRSENCVLLALPVEETSAGCACQGMVVLVPKRKEGGWEEKGRPEMRSAFVGTIFLLKYYPYS